MKLKFTALYLTCAFLLIVSIAKAQSKTVGLIYNDSTKTYNGYTLFSPIGSKTAYLINNNGNLVHSWKTPYRPAQSVAILPDGSLLRPAVIQSGNLFSGGGAGGRVEKYDWDGNLTWSFNYYTSEHCTHHDVEYLPDGDILMIAWQKITDAEAIAAGKNPASLDTALWAGEIIEVKPTGSSGGDIVWAWHSWDHIIQDFDSTKANFGNVGAHPELIDVNYGATGLDWLHINSVRYNPERDEILLSVHNFNEVWIIDHSTTTAQAAGHSGGKSGKGGDIIYRWGNPQAYRAGLSSEQIFYGQHDASWIDKGLPGQGDILVFNNGRGRPGKNYSSIDEITPPIDSSGNYFLENTGKYGPDNFTWSYTAKPTSSFFSRNLSSAERLPNGNTFICEGTSGRLFEIDSSGNIVWDYVNPVTRNGIVTQGDTATNNLIYRAIRYSPQYSGLNGKDLSSKGPIEKYPTGIKEFKSLPSKFRLYQNYPNPFNPTTTISYAIHKKDFVTIKIYDLLGREVATIVNEVKDAGNYKVNFNASNFSSGVYFYRMQAGNFIAVKKLILMK